MAETTAISWTDATFNPWIGCTKVSPACDHCYAETLATTRLGVAWGPHAPRRRTAASTWKHPLAWNRKAEREGRRIRVFCASLADVFDNAVDASWRADLFALIEATPHLDWQLLTKRPQNIRKMLPDDWGAGYPNVWLGTTVEDQVEADRRIPLLLEVPAALRFLSCEPLLGPVDLHEYLLGFSAGHPAGCACGHGHGFGRCPNYGRVAHNCHRCGCTEFRKARFESGLHQIITGGESGKDARPSHPDWFRSLRDQCAGAGVAFHFKQWGEWVTEAQSPEDIVLPGECRRHWAERDDGADWTKGDQTAVFKVGTKRSGHLLDGVEHRAVPV